MTTELYRYGVKGMKWDVCKAIENALASASLAVGSVSMSASVATNLVGSGLAAVLKEPVD